MHQANGCQQSDVAKNLEIFHDGSELIGGFNLPEGVPCMQIKYSI